MAKNFYDMARCVETVEKIRQLFEPLNGWQRCVVAGTIFQQPWFPQPLHREHGEAIERANAEIQKNKRRKPDAELNALIRKLFSEGKTAGEIKTILKHDHGRALSVNAIYCRNRNQKK